MKRVKIPLFDLNERLQIEPTRTTKEFSAPIIGLKLRNCLILDCTGVKFGSSRLKSGDELWGRCIRRQTIRFRSKILKIVDEPIPLMFLEYPRSVEVVDFRSAERNKTFIRSEFSYLKTNGNNGNDHAGEGYILDISSSGCLLWDDFIHIMDHDILLTFEVPWLGKRMKVKARIVRSDIVDTGICSGMQFIDMDPRTKMHINHFARNASHYLTHQSLS